MVKDLLALGGQIESIALDAVPYLEINRSIGSLQAVVRGLNTFLNMLGDGEQAESNPKNMFCLLSRQIYLFL